MKKIIHLKTILSLTIFLFYFFKIDAQNGLYDVRFTVKNVDCKTKIATIAVQVKANSNTRTFYMGDANYRFDFDPRQIRNPRIVSQENFSNLAPSIDFNYGPQNLNGTSTGTTLGTVSLNTFYTGSNNSAKKVGSDWMTVSCIAFDIQNGATCFGLRWHTNTEFPITGMSEVERLVDDYNLHVVAASGQFGNVQYCDLPKCNNTAPVLTMPTDVMGKQDSIIQICGTVSDDKSTQNLIVSFCKAPKLGSATPSVSGNQICFTYTPTAGVSGKDTLCIRICDEQGECVEKTINIDITKRPLSPCEADKVPPVITIIDPILRGHLSGDTLVFNCDNMHIFDSTSVAATDNSGFVHPIRFIDIVSKKGVCPIDGFKMFMACDWIATDSCGNEARFKIYIKIIDNKPPVFNTTISDNIVVNLNNGQTIPSNPMLTATDNCGEAIVKFEETKTDTGNDCDYIITRTWTATDDCANTTQQKQTIKVINQLTVSYIATPETCNSKGTAKITTTNAAITWPDGSTDALRSNLKAGTYSVTVTNMQGCRKILTIEIADNCPCNRDKIPPVITFTHPLLRGHRSGDTLSFDCENPPVFDSLSVTATDNSGFVNPIQFIDKATKKGICPVDGYKILMECDWIATDSCGNVARLKIYIKIIDNKAPYFTSDLPKDITVNLNDGQAIPEPPTLSAKDNCGAPSFSYSEKKTSLESNCDYTLTRKWVVKDECDNTIQHVQNITVRSRVSVNYTVTPETCPKNNGTISFAPTSLTYKWADEQTGAVRRGLKAGNYTVTITSNTGCSISKTVTVKDSCPCQPFLAEDNILKILDNCEAEASICLKIKKDRVKGYFDNGVYYVGGITSCEDGNTQIKLKKGTHQIIVVNSEGCKDTVNVKVICITPEERVINLYVGQKDTSCLDLREMLGFRYRVSKILRSNNQSAVFNIVAGTSCIETYGLSPGKELATFVISDEIGVVDTAYFTANVMALARQNTKSIVIHNAFSPNGDQLNDYFAIENVEKYPNNQLTIYNRWGNQVHFKKQYNNDWDGRWNGQHLPDGTYFYIFEDGEGNRYSGYLQILR